MRATGLAQGEQSAVVSRVLREGSAAPTVLSRARYTEERLSHAVARGIGQYVLVGAGLDTFAYRQPELSERLQIFELDHARSQCDKRAPRQSRLDGAAQSPSISNEKAWPRLCTAQRFDLKSHPSQ
jgi:hypothetical protein